MQEELKGYINLDEGLGRVRGNKTLFKRMLGLFLANDSFAQLEESLAAGEYEKAGEHAHAIKGMTGNLSLTPLFEASTTLMNELRQGQPASEGALATYRDAYEKTRVAVEELVQELE